MTLVLILMTLVLILMTLVLILMTLVLINDIGSYINDIGSYINNLKSLAALSFTCCSRSQGRVKGATLLLKLFYIIPVKKALFCLKFNKIQV